MRLPRILTSPWVFTGAALAVGGAIAFGLLYVGHDSRDAFVDPRPPPGLAERFYPPENWAWGLIQASEDAPVQRYGVSAPDLVAKGQVLILPDYGESAETWFETARDLNAAGYIVWVLDGVGQGGSARLTGHRDLGQVRSFEPDVAGVRAMIGDVIRPTPEHPLIILGGGVGGLVAARAAEEGVPMAGLVLSAPSCWGAKIHNPLGSLGLGAIRAPGFSAWSRPSPAKFIAPQVHDPWRTSVAAAWQLVNPDLRMGGPSLDWQAAYIALQADVRANIAAVLQPALVLGATGHADCLGPNHMTPAIVETDAIELELEDDARRGQWLAAITGFLADRAPKPPQPHPAASHAP